MSYPLLCELEKQRTRLSLGDVQTEILELQDKLNAMRETETFLQKKYAILNRGRCDLMLHKICQSDERSDFKDAREQEDLLTHFKHYLTEEQYGKIAPGLFANRHNIVHVCNLYNIKLPPGF
jgi:hypothetical protein